MVFKLENNIRETTSNQPVAGGTSILSGKVASYRDFVTAFANNDQTIVTREGTNAAETLHASYNAGNVVPLSLLDSSTGALIDWSVEGENPEIRCVSSKQLQPVAHPAVNASNDAFIDWTDLQPDCTYQLQWENVLGTAADEDMMLRVSNNNGSSFFTSGYDGDAFYSYANGTPFGTNRQNACIINMNVGADATEEASGLVTMFSIRRAGERFQLRYSCGGKDADGFTSNTQDGAFYYDTAAEINAIRVLMNSGNINQGRFILKYWPSL